MPANVSNALQQLGSTMDSAGNEALRFPLSVGERREDTDHTGAPSYVVDAIFNADVVRYPAPSRCPAQLPPAACCFANNRIIFAGDHQITGFHQQPVQMQAELDCPLQIDVAANVRQLKTFICNLLLEYVGTKVSSR